MFFFLSKILYFLIDPISWLMGLIVLAFLFRKKNLGRKYGIAAVVIFLLFSNQKIYKTCVLAWQLPPKNIHQLSQFSAGILLGGMSMFDKDRNAYLGSTTDRLVQTVILYQQGIIQKIILTGGTGSLDQTAPKEADHLSQILIQMKINPADIIIENQSRNTFENAVFTKKLITSNHLKPPYLLISSAIHLPRALKVFEQSGLEVVPFPSAYTVIPSKENIFTYLIPQLDVLCNWKYLIKEVVGLWVYQITGKA